MSDILNDGRNLVKDAILTRGYILQGTPYQFQRNQLFDCTPWRHDIEGHFDI